MARAIPLLSLLIVLLGVAPVMAVQPDEVLPNATQETRARTLSRELRCMVCQNQSIDDSDAPLARDLRLLVRERIAAGDSDGDVMNFLVARYGEFVLLKPRFEIHTLLLWMLPPLALVLGGLGMVAGYRRRRSQSESGIEGDAPAKPLTAEETARLASLTEGPV